MRSAQVMMLVVAVMLALAMVSAASAAELEEPTRESFVSEAEPICRTNVFANKRIFQGTRKEVKNGELKRASKHFFRAATAFGRTIRELAALPRPSADAARIAKWLGILKDEKAIILKIGKALAAEQKHRASSYSVDLNRNSNMANNAVIPFGFNYCRIEPSRFSG